MGVWFLLDLGDSGAQAIQVAEPLLADYERILGPDHSETLTARNNLATAYQEAGRAAEAIPLHERTLAGSERVLYLHHPGHPATPGATSPRPTGTVGRTAEAIALHERTLADRERAPGHRITPTSYNPGTTSPLRLTGPRAGTAPEAIALVRAHPAPTTRRAGPPDHPGTLWASREPNPNSPPPTGPRGRCVALEAISAVRRAPWPTTSGSWARITPAPWLLRDNLPICRLHLLLCVGRLRRGRSRCSSWASGRPSSGSWARTIPGTLSSRGNLRRRQGGTGLGAKWGADLRPTSRLHPAGSNRSITPALRQAQHGALSHVGRTLGISFASRELPWIGGL